MATFHFKVNQKYFVNKGKEPADGATTFFPHSQKDRHLCYFCTSFQLKKKLSTTIERS